MMRGSLAEQSIARTDCASAAKNCSRESSESEAFMRILNLLKNWSSKNLRTGGGLRTGVLEAAIVGIFEGLLGSEKTV